MFEIYHSFLLGIKKGKIKFENKYLNNEIKRFSFHLFIKENFNPNLEIQQIIQIMQKNEYKSIFIIEYKENVQGFKFNSDFFIVCFDKTVLIIEQNQINLFSSFFSQCQKSIIYVLSENIKNIIEQKLKLHLQFSIENNYYFREEIRSFTNKFYIQDKKLETFLYLIGESISGFLIKKGYDKAKNFDRILHYDDYQNEFIEKTIEQDEYIVLRNLGMNNVFLIYHIEKEELLVMKLFLEEKSNVLFERERFNYLNIHHPFFPKYYGITEFDHYKAIIIEYIYGKSVDDVNEMKLKKEVKMKIIFQIMIGIKYLHSFGFIYRDLKPNNIIINDKNSIIIIDFDRMVNNVVGSNFTRDFAHEFIAPEINYDISFSKKSDIYSLGKIIEFIFSEEFSNNKNTDYLYLKRLCNRCTILNYEERPNISEVIDCFYYFYFSKITMINEMDIIIHNKNIIHDKKFDEFWLYISEYDHPISQYELGRLHGTDSFPFDTNRKKVIEYLTLSANQNYDKAQQMLGTLYYRGEDVPRDINKSIMYYTQAANQNNAKAQYCLGIMFENGDFVARNINKAIYYYTLAANQGESMAQFVLATMYLKGTFIPRDIKKAIHFYTLSANLDDLNAQLALGMIYSDKKYNVFDINKAIYYFTLSSNHHNSNAQYYLGLIYETGSYTPKYINKAIYYYSLAANQNHTLAQYNLGLIYLLNKDIPCDPNKAIYYLSLAANKKFSDAYLLLSVIYSANIYVPKDIDKSISYLMMAVDLKNPVAQYYLAIYYHSGEYVPKNKTESVYYMSLSANNNYPEAQVKMGFLYLTGLYVPKNIEKSIFYFTKAQKNKEIEANFYLGYIYFKGDGVMRDIDKSIQYYKECSSFNDQYSKNNLGILYKNIKRNGIAEEYFKEAISQKNDVVSMYNLGHMYLYGDLIQRNLNKSIELLIKSVNYNFSPSKILLSLAITTKLKLITLENVSTEIEKYESQKRELNQEIYNIIKKYKLENEINYTVFYTRFEKYDYFYDHLKNAVLYEDFMNEPIKKESDQHKDKNQRMNLTDFFYTGFYE